VTRLYVLVEGQSEEEFVKSVLALHLGAQGTLAIPIIVETSRDRFGRKRRGGGDWTKWRRDLLRLTGQHHGPLARFTTMFDLHGLPRNFPKLAEHRAVADTKRRAELLEAAMSEDVGDWRLIPYLQRHEFEALVLASINELKALLDAQDQQGAQTLLALVAAVGPEDVNDGDATAPSKRLEANIPSYQKTVHGPLAIEATGIARIRAACPRFNAWVTRLEALSAEAGP
jgi:Domain of unknown function (DUF4276)